MNKLIKIITGNHLSTKRDYLSRMSKKKPLFMKESKNLAEIIGMVKDNMVMADIGTSRAN